MAGREERWLHLTSRTPTGSTRAAAIAAASGRSAGGRLVAVVRARRSCWSSASPSCTAWLPPGRPIPYSEFKTLLKNGAVAEVIVGEQVIRGTLKQPLPSDAEGIEAVHDHARRGSEAHRGARSAAA